LISVFRRVREIGTLRAIGASDSYIRSLIYCENILIALVAGFAGVFFGSLFLEWINSLDIHISNQLIVSVLDGTSLQIEFLPHIAAFSFAVAVLLGLAAGVYPVEAAVRIEPETAVRRG
jgi:putative ABC transport system permease protein